MVSRVTSYCTYFVGAVLSTSKLSYPPSAIQVDYKKLVYPCLARC